MDALFQIDWKAMFVPTVGLLEMALRGTLIYLLLFVFMRIMRREAGSLGLADVLVVVLIADASQNAMATEYKSITEGAVLVGTIFLWDFALDALAYRVPAFARLVRPRALLLVADGRMLRRNMQKEQITQEELQSQLRENGVEDLAEVRKCFLEGDGRISVIKKS
jgi:uncharacterized membrane protein YcaP (DUF421 family)